MPRKLVWIENPNYQGYGCSECAWVFTASGPLVGNSIEEMKRRYETQRDEEFATHICAGHPKTTKPGK
jgi:hypothetical protein